jgi:hypothetical protein
MYLLSFFTTRGLPASGLTPTIRVRTVFDGALIVEDGSMVEVGDGWYKYDFATYDPAIDYAIRCDGGSGQPVNERYTFAGSDNSAAVWSSTLRTLTAFGFTVATASDGDIAAIKATTAALPTEAEIWQRVVEAGLTAEELLRLMSAVLAGKVIGAGTPTITFQAIGDSKARVTASVDQHGNRLSVTTDVS